MKNLHGFSRKPHYEGFYKELQKVLQKTLLSGFSRKRGPLKGFFGKPLGIDICSNLKTP